jgi:hypothetical protein
MKDNEGRRMVMHPAWQAAHELLSDGEKWWRTLAMEQGGYSMRQIAVAMRCMGFGADVTETEWRGALAVDWELPDVWIPVDHNNSLDVYVGVMATLGISTLADFFRDGVVDERARVLFNGAG